MQLSPALSMSPSVSSPGNGFYGDIDGWCEDVKEVADDIESTASCVPKCENITDIEWIGNNQKLAAISPNLNRFNAVNAGQYESIRRICLVCSDIASGLHYGIASCEACKAFFKRTVQGRIEYVCPASGQCEMNRKRRKACQACRYKKCIDQGMNPDGIRPDRSKGGQSTRYGAHRPGSQGGTAQSNTSASQRSDIHNQNKILSQLLNIEPQKVYASPNDLMMEGEEKTMMTLANLVDRELVATIGWAKLVPGFLTLPLSDQMRLLQRTWLDILHLNFSYRSSVRRDVFVFSDDFQVSESDFEGMGLSLEFTTMTRLLANKLASLSVTKEEYILLKAMVLLNSDIGTDDSFAVDSVRHQMFDALLHYERSRSRAGASGSSAVSSRRAGDLLLTLPLLTHQVAFAKDFWRRVKSQGHVSAHRLLDEMVDHALAV